MKNLLLISALISMFAGSAVQANAPYSLNAVKGMSACKFHIQNAFADADADADTDIRDIRFQSDAATSIRGGTFKYWINASTEIDSETSNLRFVCEVTRTGELVELVNEPGRWSI